MLEVLAAPAPDSPGDFAFIAVTAVVVIVLSFVRKAASVRKDRRLREEKIAQLMQESSAFSARWPGHRIATAPSSEIAAEHARSNRLLALLAHHRVASDRAYHQHIESQITGVQHWLASLPARVTAPSSPRHAGQPPAAGASPPRPPIPPSVVTPSVSANGFPLGEPLLHLRGIPGADDIVCSVESVAFQRLAVIRPCGPTSWRDTTADAHFEVLRPDGAPLMYVKRCGGFSQRLEAHDLSGYCIGTLHQTSSIWKTAGTQRVEFEVACGGQQLGSAQVRQRSWSSSGEDPVHDAMGRQIALVEPVLRDPREYRPSYDFTLHCVEPQPFPFAELLLVVGFSHYLYSRTWR